MYLLCVFTQNDSIQFQLSSGTKSLENWTLTVFSLRSASGSVCSFPTEEEGRMQGPQQPNSCLQCPRCMAGSVGQILLLIIITIIVGQLD